MGSSINGTAGNDTLTGTTGTTGNDTLDGAAGLDTAVYTGARADYDISYDASTGNLTVRDRRAGAPDGTDVLRNVETIQFADGAQNVAAVPQRRRVSGQHHDGRCSVRLRCDSAVRRSLRLLPGRTGGARPAAMYMTLPYAGRSSMPMAASAPASFW